MNEFFEQGYYNFKNVSGDGNCYFHALAVIFKLYGVEEANYENLRKKLNQFIEDNQNDLNEYDIQGLSEAGGWVATGVHLYIMLNTQRIGGLYEEFYDAFREKHGKDPDIPLFASFFRDENFEQESVSNLALALINQNHYIVLVKS